MSYVTRDPKFDRGTPEDSLEFLEKTFELLEKELENNFEGEALLRKFIGKEAFLRKFTYPRFVFSNNRIVLTSLA